MPFSILRSRDIRGAKARPFVSPLRQWQIGLAVQEYMGMGVPQVRVGKTISWREASLRAGEEEIAYDQVEPAAAGEEEIAYDRVEPVAGVAGAKAGETGDRVPRPYPA